jgi:hypothetical protein
VPDASIQTPARNGSEFTKGWFEVQPERKRTSATEPANQNQDNRLAATGHQPKVGRGSRSTLRPHTFPAQSRLNKYRKT